MNQEAMDLFEDVEEAPQPPEDTRSKWEQQGFLRDIALVAEGMEDLEEKFLLPANIRQIIETVLNAKTVQDFSRYSDSDIETFISVLRRDVPNIERQAVDLMGRIDRAQTAAFEVDFI